MKRLAIAALAVSSLAGMGLAEAGTVGRKPSRALRQPYSPNPYDGIHLFYRDPSASVTTVHFYLHPGENRVMPLVEDEDGTPAGAVVYQSSTEIARFCGSPDEPVVVNPRLERFEVQVLAGPCVGNTSTSPEGLIEMEFYKTGS